MKADKIEGAGDYVAKPDRYDTMTFRRCGDSGLLLPLLSLGLWHNFGSIDSFEVSRAIVRKAFDLGITHFDLANNYGPPPGSAEETFGKILKSDLLPYRDQIIISTKAGYEMWNGPYGNFGSRKYLLASLDQSIKRMGLDYVDIFYHHRPDPDTPLEETMLALDQVVRQGKAIYAGISNYNAETTLKASKILRELNTPFVIHQGRYSMLDRWVEDELLNTLNKTGTGFIAFSPLAQGILSDKYLNGIPEGSRAAKSSPFLTSKIIEPYIPVIKKLNKMASSRNQSLSQMAVSWLMSNRNVTSVLVGVSSVRQLEDNFNAIDRIYFTIEEINLINDILLTLPPGKR